MTQRSDPRRLSALLAIHAIREARAQAIAAAARRNEATVQEAYNTETAAAVAADRRWRNAQTESAIDLTQTVIARAAFDEHRVALQEFDDRLAQAQSEVNRARSTLRTLDAQGDGLRRRARQAHRAAEVARDDRSATAFLDRLGVKGSPR